MCVRLFDINGKFLANSLETINLHGKSRKKTERQKKSVTYIYTNIKLYANTMRIL